MGIALTEVGLLPFELTKAEIESARELGALVVDAHRLHLGEFDHRGSP